MTIRRPRHKRIMNVDARTISAGPRMGATALTSRHADGSRRRFVACFTSLPSSTLAAGAREERNRKHVRRWMMNGVVSAVLMAFAVGAVGVTAQSTLAEAHLAKAKAAAGTEF